MTEELLKRLEAVRYEREDWHEPYGSIDLPCDADDYGAKAVHRNPDGPEAAALIRQLKAENERLEAVRDAILSAGSANRFGDKVTFGTWSLNKLATAFDRAAQSLNQTERGEG